MFIDAVGKHVVFDRLEVMREVGGCCSECELLNKIYNRQRIIIKKEQSRKKKARSKNYIRRRNYLLRKYGYKCWRCGLESETCMTLDHIIPQSQGGSHRIENCRILCIKCHRSRNEGIWEDKTPNTTRL